MGHKFAEIAFTPIIRELQVELGSRSFYAEMDRGADYNHQLTAREAQFIAARDSFYMASVTETGWPYIQHRGGLPGFMKVLDEGRIGFADYSGNRQYVSTGNFTHDNRVALFFMDYPNRRRLKMLGRVTVVSPEDQDTLAQLTDHSYPAQIERGFVIEVEAFDWNCPQHITQRYTAENVEALFKPLKEENQRLRASQSNHTDRVIGNGSLEVVISGIRQLTPRIREYELRDPQGRQLPEFEAGAHLTVPVVLENGTLDTRHYSITSNPQQRSYYQIAVLREDQGQGGSLALHSDYQLGNTLRIEPPENHFALHDEHRPTVLIAGGVGITPIHAMIHTLNRRNSPWHLHYAGRSLREMAYSEPLQALGEQVTVYPSDVQQRLSPEQILRDASDDTVFYVCGPSRLIDSVIVTADELRIDPQRIRFERFSAGAIANAHAIEVTLKRSGKVIDVGPEETVLDAMLGAGIDAPFSCKSGACKTCAVKIIDGEAEHHDSVLSEEELHEKNLFCPCVSRAKTNNLTLDI